MAFSATEDVPLEIWVQICRFACLWDDGSSAVALSQVSRAMNAAVQPSRYLNVALRDNQAVIQFQQLLNDTDAAPGMREMRHLFVSMPSVFDHAHADHGWWNGDADGVVRPKYAEAKEDVDDGDEDSDPDDESESDPEDTEDPDYESDDGDPAPLWFDLEGAVWREMSDGDDSDASSDSDDYEYSIPTSEEWCIEYGHNDELDPASDGGELADGPGDKHVCDTIEEKTHSAVYNVASLEVMCPKSRGTQLVDLSRSQSLLSKLEWGLLEALRRILIRAAPTLQVLYVDFAPSSTLLLEAVFPELPRLEHVYVRQGPSRYTTYSAVARKFVGGTGNRDDATVPCPRLFPRARTARICPVPDYSPAAQRMMTHDVKAAVPEECDFAAVSTWSNDLRSEWLEVVQGANVEEAPNVEAKEAPVLQWVPGP